MTNSAPQVQTTIAPLAFNLVGNVEAKSVISPVTVLTVPLYKHTEIPVVLDVPFAQHSRLHVTIVQQPTTGTAGLTVPPIEKEKQIGGKNQLKENTTTPSTAAGSLSAMNTNAGAAIVEGSFWVNAKDIVAAPREHITLSVHFLPFRLGTHKYFNFIFFEKKLFFFLSFFIFFFIFFIHSMFAHIHKHMYYIFYLYLHT